MSPVLTVILYIHMIPGIMRVITSPHGVVHLFKISALSMSTEF